MDLNAVMDELGARLNTISGLRVSDFPPPTVTPPAGIVSYPDRVEFDATYGRGVDVILDLPIVIVEGKATDRGARDRISAYAAGSGTRSVKQVIESGTYTSFDEVRVKSAEFDVITIAGIDYISVLFRLDIGGPGSA
ncbi:hypothetical protein Cme02nite_69380 [Catellatospora methionotrophica]|uniref:Uncharacterized protein n=1 Tax=Catellatospora methionotrophica TaxID=121620 RepID=A0A8J3LNN5_9ACTN|nr:hypothetical protein [Catellatospora methionotrophica]GIG18606.1 hypothetical protein Cme02nite_69380 [Catellatospora methionotrophica]